MDNTNGVKSRYADQELQEFKDIIDKKLVSAYQELHDLQEQIRDSQSSPEDKSAGHESGSMTLEKEYLNQLAARQGQYIHHLENALIRIQNKTYGICRVTGNLIAKDRLKAVPHTTLSIEAKLGKR